MKSALSRTRVLKKPLRILARKRGIEIGFEYAEVFMILREKAGRLREMKPVVYIGAERVEAAGFRGFIKSK